MGRPRHQLLGHRAVRQQRRSRDGRSRRQASPAARPSPPVPRPRRASRSGPASSAVPRRAELRPAHLVATWLTTPRCSARFPRLTSDLAERDHTAAPVRLRSPPSEARGCASAPRQPPARPAARPGRAYPAARLLVLPGRQPACAPRTSRRAGPECIARRSSKRSRGRHRDRTGPVSGPVRSGPGTNGAKLARSLMPCEATCYRARQRCVLPAARSHAQRACHVRLANAAIGPAVRPRFAMIRATAIALPRAARCQLRNGTRNAHATFGSPPRIQRGGQAQRRNEAT